MHRQSYSRNCLLPKLHYKRQVFRDMTFASKRAPQFCGGSSHGWWFCQCHLRTVENDFIKSHIHQLSLNIEIQKTNSVTGKRILPRDCRSTNHNGDLETPLKYTVCSVWGPGKEMGVWCYKYNYKSLCGVQQRMCIGLSIKTREWKSPSKYRKK